MQTKALDVPFTLSALPDVPGHKHQTKCQTFNALQALLGEEEESGNGPVAWARLLSLLQVKSQRPQVATLGRRSLNKVPPSRGQKVGSGRRDPRREERKGRSFHTPPPHRAGLERWLSLICVEGPAPGNQEKSQVGIHLLLWLQQEVLVYSEDPETGCSCRTGGDEPCFSLISLATRELY